MKQANSAVSIIGVQMDLGASLRGVNMGPLAIRFAGLAEGLEELGYHVTDLGDIQVGPPKTDNPKMKNFEPIFQANKSLHEQCLAVLKDGDTPIILGGDHGIAAGSISASAKHFKNIGVIWMDAHGDFNNEESSPSGNMHGMPLSALTGYGPDAMVAFSDDPVYVDPKKVVLIGGRDIDREERKRLEVAGVNVFSIHDVDRMGMAQIIEKALSLAGDGTEGIHVSFDMDAITPQEAPGTGTTVHSGLTVREAFLAAEMVAESGKVIAVDMVEVNPMLDERNKTGHLASEMVLSFLGKAVF
ncbi:MAG: arginase [Anaerovoracaceae bacterium]